VSRLLAAVLLVLVACSCAATDLQPYRQGDWNAILKGRAGGPLIVHFWGVTCAPCVVELPQWGRFLERRAPDSVVFIETDVAPDSAVSRMIRDARLEAASNWAAQAPFDEYARYEIDTRWQGEIPFTLLIDRKGRAQRVVGQVDFGKLASWLDRQGAPAITHPQSP